MRETTTALLRGLLARYPKQTIWEWARDNVDFSRVPAYDTPLHSPYDPEYIPQFKEIAECDTDPNIRETWVVKPSRCGASENTILNAIRYHIARDPLPILYVTGSQKGTEEFMEARIKGGMPASSETQAKYRRARALEHRIDFEDMQLMTTWPSNKMAFKQSGWARVYIDEYSLVKETVPGVMRKRTDTYQFSHICGISSMDAEVKRASKDDPILVEFKSGDMREWFMADPETGNQFKWEMGAEDSEYGLKWDKAAKQDDGTWDMDMVRATAYYVTPDGTRIDNKRRMSVTRTGEWCPTNPHAPKDKRSYHLNAFGLPFKCGDFGQIACAFLDAKHRGKGALKVFVYEYLAEEWYDEIERTDDETLQERQGKYPKGGSFCIDYDGEKDDDTGKYPLFEIYAPVVKTNILTMDVQQAHLWAVVREWVDGGESGLREYACIPGWQEAEALAAKYEAGLVYVDCGYARRKMEVYEYCYKYTACATVGSEKLKEPFRRHDKDPFEGKSGQGESTVTEYTFHTDFFKCLLQDMLMGRSLHRWHIYGGIDREYLRQVASEERVNGAWQVKRGHPNNHLWDCEVIQLVAATVAGIYRSAQIDEMLEAVG